MTTAHRRKEKDRIGDALSEMQTLIAGRYPDATFSRRRGIDDPDERWLVAEVDLEDTDEVMDLVSDRLLEFQVDERLRVAVIPLRRGRLILSGGPA